MSDPRCKQHVVLCERHETIREELRTRLEATGAWAVVEALVSD